MMNWAQEADIMAEKLATIPGLVDIESSYKPGQPELQLNVDPVRAGNFGLSTAQVGSAVRSLVNGQVASTFRGEGAEADIVVRLNEEDRSSIEKIMDIKIPSPTGQFVPVRNVAEASFCHRPDAYLTRPIASRLCRLASTSPGEIRRSSIPKFASFWPRSNCRPTSKPRWAAMPRSRQSRSRT